MGKRVEKTPAWLAFEAWCRDHGEDSATADSATIVHLVRERQADGETFEELQAWVDELGRCFNARGQDDPTSDDEVQAELKSLAPKLPAVVPPKRAQPGGLVRTVAELPPEIIERAGRGAEFAWDEFFYAKLSNAHTLRAYRHAATRFFAWCEEQGLELNQVSPGLVGRYLGDLRTLPKAKKGEAPPLGKPASIPMKKLHRSALNHLFDVLVERHVVVLNPVASVRAPKYSTVEGSTPDIPKKEIRRLVDSISTEDVVGLRDRAIMGILIYTAARRGAVANLCRKDFYTDGEQWAFRFLEKGGKSREIPARHDLQRAVRDYMAAAGITDAADDSPLFRTAIRRTKTLTEKSMTPDDISRMVRRRMKDAGLSSQFVAHSFRASTITNLLDQGVALADVQQLAGHADPRTTRLYDRTKKAVTRNIVERISF